MFVWVIFEFL